MTEPNDFLEKWEYRLSLGLVVYKIDADELRHLVRIARIAAEGYAWPAGTEMGMAIRDAKLLGEESP